MNPIYRTLLYVIAFCVALPSLGVAGSNQKEARDTLFMALGNTVPVTQETWPMYQSRFLTGIKAAVSAKILGKEHGLEYAKFAQDRKLSANQVAEKLNHLISYCEASQSKELLEYIIMVKTTLKTKKVIS